MWLDDLLEALKVMPTNYRKTCCYNSIKAGYKRIVFETDTFLLIYYIDSGEWEEIQI